MTQSDSRGAYSMSHKECVITRPGSAWSLLSLLTGNMASKLNNFQLCLLPLLGILGTAVSFQAIPPNLTPAQWFAIQHIKMANSIVCGSAMRVVNSYTGHCKGKNTFLNITFSDAVGTCVHTPNMRCLRSSRTNCHQSSHRVPLTDCILTRNAKNYRLCTYRKLTKNKSYVIACAHKSPNDSPVFPIVPVHLDGTV
ncbi:ribonuclease 2B [Oryctolagus cuniculus]|uniref:ribonuclease 2B n=1 Tax=Oryctolagus cuniculus TaxID=9986 RepID=UPI00387A0687